MPRRRRDARVTATDGDRYVLCAKNGAVYEINTTGLFIWQRCNGNRSMESLAHELATDRGIVLAQARHDVRCFLHHLSSERLVTFG